MEPFESMIRQHYPAVYNFLLRLCDYRSDIAEELAQDVFLQAYMAVADFQGKSSMKTWLIQIAKNTFYMYLRKNKHAAVSFETLPTEPVDTAAEFPDNELYTRELLARARLIIDSMQPHMRDVLLYRIYTDLPYAQISVLLSVSESSRRYFFTEGKVSFEKN